MYESGIKMNTYLDIETSFKGNITVFGIYFDNGDLKQLVGKEITKKNIINVLKNVNTIYTYNGSRFDLPVIKNKLGIDLEELFNCHDLMYDCWNCKIYGGLKSVEKQLSVPRKREMDGNDAMELWDRYVTTDDKSALKILLEYNSEDVINLKVLKNKLKI